MSEDRRRCRYWPMCEIHMGLSRLLADVSPRERTEIARACATRTVPEVARDYGLTRNQVRRLWLRLQREDER